MLKKILEEKEMKRKVLDKRFRDDMKRAKKARERYAEKRAKQLGISVDRFVKEKGERVKEQKKERTKSILKMARLYEKKRLLKVKEAEVNGKKIDWETVAVTIPYPKTMRTNPYIENSQYKKALEQICTMLTKKKLGHYNGDEYGFGPAKHFRWYFYLNKDIKAKRVGSLLKTILQKYDWVNGVIISMNIMYTNEQFESTKIKLS